SRRRRLCRHFEPEAYPDRLVATRYAERQGAEMHVGMVGVGRIGSLHAQTLKESPLVTRLTVVDADERRAASTAQALGAEQAATVEALLGEGVDALVIAAATPVHAELLHIAADARVPAFCEKPIARDLEPPGAVSEHGA